MDRSTLKQSFLLLRVYLRPQWPRMTLMLVLLVVSISLQLLLPQIVRDFIDLATGAIESTRFGDLDTLPEVAVFFIVVAILTQAVRAAATYVTQDVRWRATNELRADLARHSMRLDMGFHNARTAGEMISRVDEDVNLLSNFFSDFVIQVLGNVLLIVGIIVVLFREEWMIGVSFFVFVVITGWILSYVVGLGVPHWKAFFAMAAKLFGFIEERLSGIEDIRANGATAYTMLGLHRTLREQYVVEQKGYAYGMLMFSTTQGLFRIGTALGLALGGYLFQLDLITIGAVYVIVNYSAMLQEPMRVLTEQLQDLQRAVAGAKRVQDLYFVQSSIQDDAPADSRLPTGPLSVTFDHVDFQYAPDKPILHDVSLHLGPGEVLGLLGRTGSGKTTMTRLVFRLYEVASGEVRVGEIPVDGVPLGNLRRRVGLVTQEVQLFNATIRDNLTFFDDSIPDERIMTALRRLELMSWFQSLPDGLDTVLESGGRGLSAGEAQLLAFTRVFLQDPGLIILDEASSRLDPATETLIERAVDHLLEDRSAIIVAHRLATVQRADDILILQDGRVKEYGDRLELINDPESHFAGLLRTGLEEVLA